MLNSYYKELGPIALPPYQGRRKYMHTFDLANPVMAAGFEDYLDVVKELCARAQAFEGEAHMTVDEGIVKAGQTQRRPGPHVDGCFVPAAQSWGHPSPGWKHNCNNVGTVIGRMPVIVAASIAGCKCYSGKFDAQPAGDGDLSHVELPEGRGEVLEAYKGFLLSADCIHESMPMTKTTERIFLRIALPITS